MKNISTNLQILANSSYELEIQQQQQQQREQKGEHNKKYEKITFSNTLPKVFNVNKIQNMRMIKCENSDNFGRVVGKHGVNISYYKKNYRVVVGVPDEKDSNEIPYIVLFSENANSKSLDTVTKYILSHLTCTDDTIFKY